MSPSSLILALGRFRCSAPPLPGLDGSTALPGSSTAPRSRSHIRRWKLIPPPDMPPRPLDPRTGPSPSLALAGLTPPTITVSPPGGKWTHLSGLSCRKSSVRPRGTSPSAALEDPSALSGDVAGIVLPVRTLVLRLAPSDRDRAPPSQSQRCSVFPLAIPRTSPPG